MPERLFRYRTLQLEENGDIADRSMREIVEPEIFLASPEKLNDPFEFCVSSNLELIGDLDAARKTLSARLPKEILRGPTETDVSNLIRALIREEIRNFWNGVACFQEANDCVLTWAHYASGHSGICIEYDPAMIDIAEFKKVKYSLMPPNASQFIPAWKNKFEGEGEKDIFTDFMNESLTTKGKPWEYEREWRLVSNIDGGNRVHTLPQEAIKAVYFGINTAESHRAQLSKAIGDRYPCFEAELDYSQYKIGFNKVVV